MIGPRGPHSRRHAQRRAVRARQDRALEALLTSCAPPPPRARLARAWRLVLPLLVVACAGSGFGSTWRDAPPPSPAIEALALL